MKTFYFNLKDKHGRVIYKSKEVFTSESKMQDALNVLKPSFPFFTKVEVFSNEVKEPNKENIQRWEDALDAESWEYPIDFVE